MPLITRILFQPEFIISLDTYIFKPYKIVKLAIVPNQIHLLTSFSQQELLTNEVEQGILLMGITVASWVSYFLLVTLQLTY
jgi:hypothetical protein